ncbi:sialate O-acetylesterase [Dyadobacter soli]|uniref:sialate O-acetylesterase n=1 Tax=Dyadobacter soli TaxID=659014 RepID=UPI0015A06DB3|nr:sialate O-acetylesterase [Dyadobacter soli]
MKNYIDFILAPLASATSRVFTALCLLPLTVWGQLEITFPQERAIFQRNLSGNASVSICGNYFQAAQRIEARVIAVKPGEGEETAWTILEQNPSGGIFNGSVKIPQGWYSLQVRAIQSGKTVGIDTLGRVGVGEVFIISGQSNAQGVNDLPGIPLPPGAADDRVNYIAYNNEANNSLNDPPSPLFAHLDIQDNISILGPRGHTAWCWGMLGDSLVKRLNVPVLFINTAWSGTSIQNWLDSSKGLATSSVYSDSYQFPDQMPYANLRIAAQNYARQYGVRSILWMLGESDTYPVRMGYENFKYKLESVINALTIHTGYKIPWMIARTSRIVDNTGSTITSQAIIDAQNAVITDLGDKGAYGPETDNLPVSRIDGTHFYGNEALQVLAGAWNRQLDDAFFDNIAPVPPSDVPVTKLSCSTDDSSVSLRLADGYRSYGWTIANEEGEATATGQTMQVSAPGTYSAIIKDEFGNSLRTQKITIAFPIKPVAPVIQPSGNIQICRDSTVSFFLDSGKDIYQWYSGDGQIVQQAGGVFQPKEAGSFFTKAFNVLGCESDRSNTVSLTIRAADNPPVLVLQGPFNIKVQPVADTASVDYVWLRDSNIIPRQSRNTLIVDSAGIYTAKAAQSFYLDRDTLVCYSASSNSIEIGLRTLSDQYIVYPNPAESASINVLSKTPVENARIMIYDVSGRLIYNWQGTLGPIEKFRLPLKGPGEFIVQITSAASKRTIKVVIR